MRGGLLSEEFAVRGAEVTGVDLSPTAIDAARGHAGKSGLSIDYRNCAVKELVDKGETLILLYVPRCWSMWTTWKSTVRESSALFK